MKKILIGILCLSLTSLAWAKDLTMTYQQYKNMTPTQWQQLESNHQYSNFILEFEKGDNLQFVVNGNFLKTGAANLASFKGITPIIVQNNFWLKMPWEREGDLYFSADGKHYTKLDDAFHGSSFGFQNGPDMMVVNVNLNASFLPTSSSGN